MKLTDLRALLRLTLTAVVDWPDATLDDWLREGIRAYSAELPRALRHTVTLATGTQVYALPADCLAVTGVEYPAGEHPPEMVWLVDEGSRRFRSGGPYYALRGVADTGSLASEPHNVEIRLAQTVTTGETAVVAYHGLHAIPYQDAEYSSVPRAHWEALFAFCQFRAAAELEHDASWKECIANDKLTQLSAPARAGWQRWREVMDRLRGGARQGGTGWVSWGDVGL